MNKIGSLYFKAKRKHFCFFVSFFSSAFIDLSPGDNLELIFDLNLILTF